MTEGIVVGVDGSSASDAAVDWAIDWAARTGAALRLTAVVDASWAGLKSTGFSTAYTDILEVALTHAAERSSTAHPTTSLRFGGVVEELIVESHGADLLVIGTNKTSRLAGVIHGTTPLKLADAIYRPMVVVPPWWSQNDGPVIVGLDSATDHEALRFAAVAAEAFDVPLVLLHSWQTPPLLIADVLAYREVTDSMKQTGSELLDETESTLSALHPSLTIVKKLAAGEPAEVLVQSAEDARMVVLGSHQRHALNGLLLGSVGHDLLMNMPCPVAIVPPSTAVDQ
ncbi:MAG: universal stress protein [Actinomycetota bacterium]